MAKGLGWRILSRLLGLIIFLVMILAVNILNNYIQNTVLDEVVKFLNKELLTIILISVFFVIAEIFTALDFPFDLPTPLFNGIASIFLVSFLLDVFVFVIRIITGENLAGAARLASFVLYPLVFIIVIIVGYVSIFSRMGKGKRKKAEK
ncbi:MAG: hypothetical protein V1645_04905 [archaeon]